MSDYLIFFENALTSESHEPWFAPADNLRSKDHGYVISFIWNDKTKVQEHQIFDALNISRGLIARAKIPHPIPVGFHACWMKPEQIQGWA